MSPNFLELGLTLALVAAVAYGAFKLHMPSIPFLICLGLILSPQAPLLLPVDYRLHGSFPAFILLGQLGLLCLLFTLGLEFSLGRLLKAGHRIVVSGLAYTAVHWFYGILAAWIWGWRGLAVIINGAIVTISSSAIIAKVLVDLKRTARPETEMILGITLFQDVFAALYLAWLASFMWSGQISPVSRLILSLVFLFTGILFIWGGKLLAPHLGDFLDRLGEEVFVLVTFALLFLIAGLMGFFYSEALGALLLGMLLGETEERERLERVMVPFRDFLGALFFFSFGLEVDPHNLVLVWPLSSMAAGFTLLLSSVTGFFLARIYGYSPQGALNTGLTLVPRGEFSLVLATFSSLLPGCSLIPPFTALYVLILSFLGPLLTRYSRSLYNVLAPYLKWPLTRGH